MSYLWSSDASPLMLVEVGVGQGSALSPVLSTLYFSAVIWSYVGKTRHLPCDILFYVDDGTIVCQSKFLADYLPPLTEAYGIMYNTLQDFGLDMEHSKSEIFHFTHKWGGYNLGIALLVGPFCVGNELHPALFWRYLGFYFDWMLSFKEHVWFYSTKAFTTVKAMAMLGNSVRGLFPQHKRLLYQSCVVPMATYRSKLWFTGHSLCIGLRDSLWKIQ